MTADPLWMTVVKVGNQIWGVWIPLGRARVVGLQADHERAACHLRGLRVYAVAPERIYWAKLLVVGGPSA